MPFNLRIGYEHSGRPMLETKSKCLILKLNNPVSSTLKYYSKNQCANAWVSSYKTSKRTEERTKELLLNGTKRERKKEHKILEPLRRRAPKSHSSHHSVDIDYPLTTTHPSRNGRTLGPGAQRATVARAGHASGLLPPAAGAPRPPLSIAAGLDPPGQGSLRMVKAIFGN